MRRNPVVYLKSSEDMEEVSHKSVDLLIGGSVHLGAALPWEPYKSLYRQVYCKEGLRVIRDSGVFLVAQTNAYHKGEFICRYRLLLDLLKLEGWELIDERVWQRRRADHFQVPFSHVLIFRPPGGTVTRTKLNKGSKDWFSGVWQYPQSKGGKINGWPAQLCRMVVGACTQEGDRVLDPFAGTGMLLGMAAAMGRKAIGYEIDSELTQTLLDNGCRVIGKGKEYKPTKKGFGV